MLPLVRQRKPVMAVNPALIGHRKCAIAVGIDDWRVRNGSAADAAAVIGHRAIARSPVTGIAGIVPCLLAGATNGGERVTGWAIVRHAGGTIMTVVVIMMVVSGVIRFGRSENKSTEEQDNWRSHDTHTIHGVPLHELMRISGYAASSGANFAQTGRDSAPHEHTHHRRTPRPGINRQHRPRQLEFDVQ